MSENQITMMTADTCPLIDYLLAAGLEPESLYPCHKGNEVLHTAVSWDSGPRVVIAFSVSSERPDEIDISTVALAQLVFDEHQDLLISAGRLQRLFPCQVRLDIDNHGRVEVTATIKKSRSDNISSVVDAVAVVAADFRFWLTHALGTPALRCNPSAAVCWFLKFVSDPSRMPPDIDDLDDQPSEEQATTRKIWVN